MLKLGCPENPKKNSDQFMQAFICIMRVFFIIGVSLEDVWLVKGEDKCLLCHTEFTKVSWIVQIVKVIIG